MRFIPIHNKKVLLMAGFGLIFAMVMAGSFFMGGGATSAQVDGDTVEVGEEESIPGLWWLAPVGSVLALVFAFIFYRGMRRESEGTDEMKSIAQGVREGANAYLKRQFSVVAIVLVVLAILLAVLAFVVKPPLQNGWVPFAFLTGGFFSGLCGWLGMKTATYANARTTQAARTSLNKALQVAFRSGAVMGLVVVGFALLDICIWFLLLNNGVHMELNELTVTMLTFGMGASTQALFARVGGGIYTKAADVGSDLVGKVEAGIPEDDPRNPAVLADNVGDNVGDVAGMGADLYESYAGSILASAALGVAAGFGIFGIVLPMVIAALGVIFSILGIYLVRTKEGASTASLLKSLGLGVNVSAVLIALASGGLVVYLLGNQAGLDTGMAIRIWVAILVGLLVGIIIGKAAEYYTSYDYKPTQDIAAQAETGPATVVIAGLSIGQLSTGIPVVSIAIGILLSYGLAGGFETPIQGLYGIGLAAVGMLSTLGITLATDAYGPIADNASGNATMSGLDPEVRERTDKLDSIGNTTAATGKGFAIGSAALTGLALVASYIEEVRIGLIRIAEHAADGMAEIVPGVFATVDQLRDATIAQFVSWYDISLMNPKVLAGVFIGAMLAFVFCALINMAVGRNAGKVVEEVRRQWHEIPGLMEGQTKPNYAQCVYIATRAAQRSMILPAMLAIIIPIVVGIILGPGAVMGVLFGGLTTGFVLAIMLANAGGAWDNAKKYIEAGAHGGKGSDAHKAGVVGDTVGDPLKDASGPSLNILIKLMAMVSIVFAGVAGSASLLFARWIG
ncbi:MAG: sodium-translocating pyrophosphatase [Dehalococcoidales bacterium]|nr:MAG: sodium-translocating pyrophosphatase [Dehalococcoidales bacterium]